MKYLFIGIIKLYRMTLSKLLPRCCRFYPSCSEYGLTVVRRFGAVKGGYLALWRIMRCNPYGKGGYDPAPERFYFRPERHSEGLVSWNIDSTLTQENNADNPPV